MVIEAVVILPLLLVLLIGGLEFAWAFTKKVEVTNAARIGARTASLYSSSYGQVESAVSDQMISAGFPVDAWTLVITPQDPASVGSGEPVTVRIEAQYGSVSLGGLSDWLPMPDIISSESVMRKEGG